MFKVAQRFKRHRQNSMGRATVNTGDETDPAGVVLKAGVIETGGCGRGQIHKKPPLAAETQALAPWGKRLPQQALAQSREGTVFRSEDPGEPPNLLALVSKLLT